MAKTNYPTNKWIRERFAYWQERMLLQHWDIGIVIKDSKGFNGDAHVGTANAVPTYIMGTVTVARRQTKTIVDAVIVHELGHFITSNFIQKVEQLDLNETTKSMFRDMNETLVSHLSNILTKIEEQHGPK